MSLVNTRYKKVGAIEIFVAEMNPMPKPRMTKRDIWKKRPIVERYWAYRDKIQDWIKRDGMHVPDDGAHIIFRIPVTKSWPEKRKLLMIGKPHRGQKDGAKEMDKDNLEKGFLDAVFLRDDSSVWDSRASKVWHTHGEIIVVVDHARPTVISGLLNMADNL